MKILVVDDNANDRRVLRYYLEQHHCEGVLEACDGLEGYKMARQHRPDLIVSDALMPRMDGFEFLRKVKTDQLTREIPFVFYSSVYTGSRDEELALRLGAETFITKPKEPEEFWDELSTVMQSMSQGEKPPPAEPLDEESEYLKRYSSIVAAKLEEKVQELEESLQRRREAEEALRKSEQLLATVFENIPDLTIVENAADDTLLKVNRAGEELLGYPREELLGRRPQEVFPQRLAELFTRRSGEAIAGAGIVEIPEEVLPTRLKGERTVRTKKIPIADEGGEPRYLLRISEDITEGKRAEEELFKLSSAIHQSPVSIMITDVGGCIEFVNPKFTEVTGYLADEALGQNPRLVKSGKTSPEEYRNLWLTITSGNVWHGELYNKKKNGQLYWEHVTIAPVKNREGVITHFIAIKEDITEKKTLEEQLRQAQKMEAIGQLAGGVAHDFNNMLMVIFGYANIMQMKMAEDDPLRANMDKLLAAAERAAGLTRSLLAFSRREPIDPRPLNFNDVVRKVEKLLTRIIGEDIAVRTEFGEEPLRVNADSGQIEQVLINLATNARDAMPQGGTLSIATEAVALDAEQLALRGAEGAGRYALISVTDTGTGMEQGVAERIFEPFFTTKETGKGTGLGLSIVYGIIQQHSGFITVNSEPGQGTTFRIYLPILPEPQWDGRVPVQPPRPRAGTETVLLAEDNAEIRHLARQVLTDFGYSVIEAVDGVEAVRIFREQGDKIALLVLDLVMPHMGGKEALREIQQLGGRVPAVFISGYPKDLVQKGGGMPEGSFDLLMKPISPQALLLKVREVLDRGPEEPAG
ncbi:hybrid sensor histidine kinase/response regulator [Geomesophilobacter sediminis]|uniref:histidine kinase n=1 Tax=Geomesophilobacter sediminis TaxID=2798584 RepID=A0A8J7M3B0_9BACT|nr:PAS domain S-box protein [Geomesophilobacter sediminis]MBJ6727779.1 PAS domain S-box protein [Geomesophilobacter sediminis]